MTHLTDDLRAWATLIEQEMPVPAAGQVMRNGADEIERLRVALMKIVECPHIIPRADGMVDTYWNPARMVQIAKEALGDE